MWPARPKKLPTPGLHTVFRLSFIASLLLRVLKKVELANLVTNIDQKKVRGKKEKEI